MAYDALPELIATEHAADGIRIPPDVTVPLTARVRALIDTPEMRRLTRISQHRAVVQIMQG